MKNLRLPEISDNSIDISQITESFSGIIVGYKNNKSIGVILYDNCNWFFFKTICLEGDYECDTSLYQLIKYLIERQICTNFKVLEFV